jgi:ferredoxin--NADP+ reductase
MSDKAVAIIGAGPAGLFSSRELANNGIEVFLFNRDIKPGGLAEYGIYPDKHKLKAGLRKKYFEILEDQRIHYFGNLHVGNHRDITLQQIQELGFDAILVTTGAQQVKRMGLEGEDLKGIYHAWEVVSNYNLLPPYSQRSYPIGKKVVIVGVGNVMADIARFLITKLRVDEVTAIARRGPAEVKFHQTEFAEIAVNLDMQDFERELDRVSPLMRSLGQDPEKARAFVEKACENCKETGSDTRLRLRFLKAPIRFIGNENGRVSKLEMIENTLVYKNRNIKPVPLSSKDILEIDTVILAMGSSVDDQLSLPTLGYQFNISPVPSYPMGDRSHEVFDPERKENIEGIFVAGWSRLASYGLVGISGRDGVSGARAVLQYITDSEKKCAASVKQCRENILSLKKSIVEFPQVLKIIKVEKERALKMGLQEYKFSTNQEMLSSIDLI